MTKKIVVPEGMLKAAVEDAAWNGPMFLAPEESGVPEEVKDLLLDESQERRTDFRGANVSSWARPFINAAILEAYRRGKESK